MKFFLLVFKICNVLGPLHLSEVIHVHTHIQLIKNIPRCRPKIELTELVLEVSGLCQDFILDLAKPFLLLSFFSSLAFNLN